jgi:hypothetical protein
MNEILAPAWDERIRRLRLGIELADVLGRTGLLAGLGVYSENVPRPHPVPPSVPSPSGSTDDAIGLPGIRRNPSGRFAVTFTARATAAPARLDVHARSQVLRHGPPLG